MLSNILWLLLISFLTVEVFWWGVTLNSHAVWLNNTEKIEKRGCFKELWARLYMASVMGCAMSFIVFAWEIDLIWILFHYDHMHYTFLPWIVSGVQLSHIHFFAILARCSCLDVKEWPPVSRLISRTLSALGVKLG